MYRADMFSRIRTFGVCRRNRGLYLRQGFNCMMGLLNAAIFVLCVLLPVCLGVRIGLPEDHVDMSSCFDGACISEHDWYEIGEKWHNFKETVKVMDGTNMTDIRHSIWRAFESGNILNGDKGEIKKALKEIRLMRSYMDKRTEKLREIQLKDVTTRYDHQAIIAMEGDITVQKAAYFLYNKHPSVSTLYEYNPETDTLTVVDGKEHYLGEHSRVQIVGHGRDTYFQMRLSEKTPTELAEIVRKLPIESSELGRVSLVGCNVGKSGQSEYLNDGFTEKFLKSLRADQNIRTEVSSRNGLISVSTTGTKETGKITADGIQWFSKDPLSKTVVTLGDFDEVIRAELPLTDRVPTYNTESSGSLVKLSDVNTNVHPRDSIEPIYIKKSKTESGKVELIKKVNYKDIGELINSATKRTFLKDVAFVQENIIERQSNLELIKNKILSTLDGDVIPETDLIIKDLRKNTIKRQGRVSHNDFTGEAYLKDKLTNKQISERFQFTIQLDATGNLQMDLGNIKPFLLDSGIPPNWKYVARLNGALERVINVENVRTIQSRADLIYEINMLGTFGVDYRNSESLCRYYRFGDVVYRMARNNFYIKWEGMIASDNEVRTEHLSQSQVNENDILNLKNWRWLDKQNRYIYPKDFDNEIYSDMRNKIEDSYAEEVINKEINLWKQNGYNGVREQKSKRRYGWDDVSFTLVDRNWNRNYRLQHDSGNVLKLMDFFRHGDHINIEKNFIHVLEGSTVLAIGLSESVRNFRTFYINEMLMNLNTQERISLARLIEAHPMTRGNSWGFVGETGLDVTLRGYKMKQLEIVLPRELNIARVYLLSRHGHDEENNYKFLTESDYNQIEKNMPAGELAKITYPAGTDDIHNTIMDFKPEITDAIVRTKPLGGKKILTINDLGVLSDISMGKALPIRASISLANDYIIISNHVSKAVAHVSKTLGTEFEIIESSIKVEDNNIRMTLRDRSNPLLEQEINVPMNEDLLTSKKMKEEAVQRLENLQETRNIPSKSLTTINEYLGVYGIVMGFRGAVQCFEDGKNFEGIVNVAQSLHGIYGLSQTAQRAFKKISSKLFSSGLQQVERSLSTATTEISTALTEGATAAEESLTVAGEAAEDIPVLGTVFGVYNTIQDIRRGTAIGYVDAALDAAITISALFGPEALVVTVALTIVRLVIDDFYYAISNELNNLPADATVLQKIGAVFKGIAEGIVMVVKNIADFLTLGFLSFAETSSKIDEQYEKDHALLEKMSDFHNYFKIEKEEGSHEKLIDFAAGEESWNGGNIVFRLYDDGTAKLRMQLVDDSGREKTLEKRFHLEDGASDIVLGIGESHDISFKKQSAKIFWFIPVHSKYLINEVRGERDSLHGTYYGNSNNNKFFTIQKLPDDVHLDYSLADYFYEIYGEDGDDIFYLGPQRSVVNGGNGHDTYIIPSSGGRTVINNYADDLLEDVLFLQVDFEQLNVDRIQSDLILTHGHDHDITVKNWFSGHRMGHLTFKANSGVIFNVTTGVYGQAFTKPIAVLLTGDKEKHTIDVSKGKWKNVMVITGSDASDDIIANAHDNLLDGGKGYNTIQGGAGSDTYIVKSVEISELSEWNVINNYDPKMTVDKVIFDVPIKTLSANIQGKDILLMASSNNGPKVKLENWISSEHYRHMVFLTSDDVIFKIADDIHDPDLIQPIILDASKEKTGVKLDASSAKFVNVSTIIGSDYNDNIVGNIGNNYLKGGKGSDFVSGGEGRDVYVIGQHDTGDIIDNFSEDKKDDLLLADFNYNDIRVLKSNNDTVLKITGNRIVTIVDWVRGENWRHLTIRTIDGISFKLEEDSQVGIRKYPIEIDRSGKSDRQNIKTHTRSMRSVEHIIGSNATDYLTGNQLANRIDPGFGGAYMMALGGHDQYIIKDHYEGPNIINNFARDNLTDTVKFPSFFSDITTNISGDDIIISSHYNPNTAVTLLKYKTDSDRRHIVINTVKDGIVFTIPPLRDFLPTPISIDRTNQANNLIVDLNSNTSWDNVITVVGTKEFSNVIQGNHNNNTIIGGKLSDMLSGGYGNDVIRGEEGEDFVDGGDGDDTLAGGAGDDWIDGGMGDDVIYPGPGGDHVKGGPGFDVIIVFGDANDQSGVFVDLLNGHGYGGDAREDIYVSVEGVIGSFFSDILIGDHNDNYLNGKESNDILFPLDGKDILVGGEGKDMYDIGNSKGEKIIQNFAMDRVMDYVNLKHYDLDSVYLEKRSNDLVLHVGVVLNGLFCPMSNIGPYHVEQWYKSSSFQHLTVQLAKTELVIDKFKTGGLAVQEENPDTKSRKAECDMFQSEMMNNTDYYLDNIFYY